jgi:hypothetical protein
MNNILRLHCFNILLLSATCFSTIISGIDTIWVGEAVKFNPWDTMKTAYFPLRLGADVYRCTDSVPPIDLFIANYTYCTCIYMSTAPAIGSPLPFFVSKISSDSTDFSAPLEIHDTAQYVRIDTAHRVPNIPNDSSLCLLPIVLGFNLSPEHFLVLPTHENKNVLAILQSIVWEDTVVWPRSYHRYIPGYEVTWYLQTDGSLNFSNIPVSVKPRVSNAHSQPKRIGNSTTYYNIRGQLISKSWGKAPIGSGHRTYLNPVSSQMFISMQ